MTKEELKQEAEEKYFNHKMMEFQGFYNRHYYYLGYLDSAEPREKRIAELEKENAQLKSKNCWKACEYVEPKSQWICQHIQDVVQLTKAKEILEDIIKFQPYIDRDAMFLTIGNDWKEVIFKAEQFIKDSEVKK